MKTINISGQRDPNIDNPDADAGRRAVKKKKKKTKPVERPEIVIEDNRYKAGQKIEKKKKRKPELIEAVAEPKKKKTKNSESKAVAVIDAPASAKSIKKSAVKRERAMAAVQEFVQLPAPVDEYDAEARRMFEKLVSMASQLEDQMEERIYNRDVYALNTIYSQIRELIADLRASRDISAQLAEIEQLVLMPYHKTVGQTLIDLLFNLQHSIAKEVRDEDARIMIEKKLQNTIHECASSLQQEYLQSIERIKSILS